MILTLAVELNQELSGIALPSVATMIVHSKILCRCLVEQSDLVSAGCSESCLSLLSCLLVGLGHPSTRFAVSSRFLFALATLPASRAWSHAAALADTAILDTFSCSLLLFLRTLRKRLVQEPWYVCGAKALCPL
jgi:hypothetical protein